jgi:hypothetical protein
MVTQPWLLGSCLALLWRLWWIVGSAGNTEVPAELLDYFRRYDCIDASLDDLLLGRPLSTDTLDHSRELVDVYPELA